MTITEQKKGRAHIDYIREIAIAYWAKMNWKDGFYPVCLRDAMKEHRDYLIRCLEEKQKIAREQQRERMPKCKECFTPLDQNDLFHYGMCCRDCFHARMNGEMTERMVRCDGIPIPPRIPKPRLNL